MNLFAFYFPQFYPIEQNDSWWGEGFTDWQLVQDAKAVGEDQVQPRVPLGDFYYDQSQPQVVDHQAELASHYGLDGFNFYHYWFDGQLLLDEPLRHFHANKQHKLKYCITWANETWTRQWVGDPEILIKQTENPDRDIWRKHFDYLNTFFSDPRYLRKNKMPVLCLYRPEIFPFFDEYKAFFHERARAAGHDGIYWIGLESYPLANSAKVFKHFDAKMQFQPRAYFNAQARQASPLKAMLEPLLRALPESMQRPISGLKYKIDQHQSYDYEALWQHLIDQSPNLPSNTYQSLVVDWDNGARYGDKAKYLSGANPQTFFEGLSRLVELEKARGADLLFINAWNEWSEAAYLEPDTRHHYGYLEAIQAVKSQLT